MTPTRIPIMPTAANVSRRRVGVAPDVVAAGGVVGSSGIGRHLGRGEMQGRDVQADVSPAAGSTLGRRFGGRRAGGLSACTGYADRGCADDPILAVVVAVG